MRTPAEEREQEENNRNYKQLLQQIVDSGLTLNFGGIHKTYEEMLVHVQQEQTIEKKVIPPELQARILAGAELTQEEIEILKQWQ